nr:hypothetical protein RTCK_01197 [Rhizobium sp. TCK]
MPVTGISRSAARFRADPLVFYRNPRVSLRREERCGIITPLTIFLKWIEIVSRYGACIRTTETVVGIC